MKLIGSYTSPYVRRIRILLDELACPYEFQEVAVFTEEGQKVLAKYTTTKRVPILVDGETVIWDSLIMAKYLLKKLKGIELSLKAEKEINLINEANDSGITLFQLKTFGLDPEWKNIFAQNHYLRIEGILNYFNEELKKSNREWSLTENFLYCLLDWLKFRNIYPWEAKFIDLNNYYQLLNSKPLLQKTAPR